MPRNGSKRRNQRNAPAEATRSVDLAPLKGYVGYAVRRAQMAIFGDFVESLREVDLRPAQFGVLVVIGDNPGMRQSDVSGGLGIQKANFVPLISELEARAVQMLERPNPPSPPASARQAPNDSNDPNARTIRTS